MNGKIHHRLHAMLLSLFYLIRGVNLMAGGELPDHTKVKDTVVAEVTYGNQYLLEKIGRPHSAELIYPIIDSLLCLDIVPVDLVNRLRLYMRIQRMSLEKITETVDSLFDADDIPYDLINEIHLYVSTHQEDLHPVPLPWFDQDGSPFPADLLYREWNTNIPNPYPLSLSLNDTALFLPLVSRGRLGGYTPPVTGTVTSAFGWREGRRHSGMDIDLNVWDTVRAAFSGMVRVARWYKGYGRVVVIRHWNGLETVYGHLHRLKVKPGAIVASGDFIGYGGSSGHSTGSHLHFECRFKGIALNPEAFISFEENKLLCDTIVLRRQQWDFSCYPKGARFYTVHRGDFLYQIAHRFGISVRKIRKLNGLDQHSVIRVGQKLRVI